MKDASLKAQPSLHGVVIDTKLYSRAGKENKRAGKSSEKLQIEKLDEKFAAQVADLTKQLVNKLYTLASGQDDYGYHRLLRCGNSILPERNSPRSCSMSSPAKSPTRSRALQWGT